MRTNRFSIVNSGAFLILLGLFIFATLMGGSVLSPFCTLPRANAQDNPCLAQEATLSALGLQATIDGLNYQATISALESQLSVAAVPTNAPTIPCEFPLSEDFSTNNCGWELSSDADGAARISQGQLLITANGGMNKHVLTPSVAVGDNFYVQVDVIPRFGTGAAAAIELCETGSTSLCHIFYIRPPQQYEAYRLFIGVLNQRTLLFETEYPNLFNRDQPFTLGLESLNGSYTIYVNGSAMDMAQITPHGSAIGLAVYSSSQSWPAEAFFDNLIIRETR